MKASHVIVYASIRILLWPFTLLPYSALHAFGRVCGLVVYYCVPKFRKRALSNLALCPALKLSKEEIIATAKGSIQNVIITCLEYPKLAREKDITRIATCENPDEAMSLLKDDKGIIFFCGHQANWELLFLEATTRMPGVAIGRPTRNKLLYNWVVSIREKYGGKIVEPRNAVREGLRALKRRCFLGIVGDQGMPQAGFSCDFLGRRAYTSPLPAILAYRTGAPLLVAMLRREKGHYKIYYSAPIHANPEAEMEHEVDRLMKYVLNELGKSILEHPDQWMWQHNRWKQQVAGSVKRPFRFDCIRVILPKEGLNQLLPHIPTLREIYPTEHFTLCAPRGCDLPLLPDVHYRYYDKDSELFETDYASKVVFNFTGSPSLSKHYGKLSAVQILTLPDLWKIAKAHPGSLDTSDLFYKVLRYAR